MLTYQHLFSAETQLEVNWGQINCCCKISRVLELTPNNKFPKHFETLWNVVWNVWAPSTRPDQTTFTLPLTNWSTGPYLHVSVWKFRDFHNLILGEAAKKWENFRILPKFAICFILYMCHMMMWTVSSLTGKSFLCIKFSQGSNLVPAYCQLSKAVAQKTDCFNQQQPLPDHH